MSVRPCQMFVTNTPRLPSPTLPHNKRRVRSWLISLVVWNLRNPEAHASDSTDAATSIRRILQTLQTWQHEFGQRESLASSPARPFVTLSFAQSLDGKLAANDSDGDDGDDGDDHSTSSVSSNYPLSGPESLRMTHALRSSHDGILIGGRTLAIDNPQLNNRLWRIHDDGGGDEDVAVRQPRPVVLDTHLTHVWHVGTACRIQQAPILCCSQEAAASLETLPLDAQILACACRPDGKLDLADVLHQLYSHCGIRTIMVEGGPLVLSGFMEQGLFDALCVTVAPKILGKGLGLNDASSILPFDLELPQVIVLGNDVVLLAKYEKKEDR